MTQKIADKYNFALDARTRVKDLSVGQMQKVEILKALIKRGQSTNPGRAYSRSDASGDGGII